jgi:hypothetical protein
MKAKFLWYHGGMKANLRSNVIAALYFIVPFVLSLVLVLHLRHVIYAAVLPTTNEAQTTAQLSQPTDFPVSDAYVAASDPAQTDTGGCGCPGCCAVAEL